MRKMRSVEQQINAFRGGVRIGLARHLHFWLIASGALLVILSIVYWSPIPLMFGLFFGLIGIIERRAGPNIEAAMVAYDTKCATFGEVTISISDWGDSTHYYALVSELRRADWEYEFIPQGWEPTAGKHAARIWRLNEDAAPVLTIVEAGILIPRYNLTRPKQKQNYF